MSGNLLSIDQSDNDVLLMLLFLDYVLPRYQRHVDRISRLEYQSKVRKRHPSITLKHRLSLVFSLSCENPVLLQNGTWYALLDDEDLSDGLAEQPGKHRHLNAKVQHCNR
eukprot:SAG11_NODE_16588_length_543_cov_1.376126_2_plen_110_part_00